MDYNKNKEGVDTADEMLRSYSTKASSWRWPLAAFFNQLDIVSLNTYVICKTITLSDQNRRQFLIKLGEEELFALEQSRRHEMPHLLHCKNFWVRTTQKNVVKDDPKILGTDAPNPNFLGQKIWVASTQKIIQLLLIWYCNEADHQYNIYKYTIHKLIGFNKL